MSDSIPFSSPGTLIAADCHSSLMSFRLPSIFLFFSFISSLVSERLEDEKLRNNPHIYFPTPTTLQADWSSAMENFRVEQKVTGRSAIPARTIFIFPSSSLSRRCRLSFPPTAFDTCNARHTKSASECKKETQSMKTCTVAREILFYFSLIN